MYQAFLQPWDSNFVQNCRGNKDSFEGKHQWTEYAEMDIDEDFDKDVSTGVGAEAGLYFDHCSVSYHHWCVIRAIANGLFFDQSQWAPPFSGRLKMCMNQLTWIEYVFLWVPPLMLLLIA